MNIETLYDAACENLRLACINQHDGDEEDGLGLFEIIKKDPEAILHISNPWNFGKVLPAVEIYAMAKEELGKAKGGTAYSAFKRIVKRNKKNGRRVLEGTWKDSDGRYCVCDGYLAIRLTKHVEGFEEVDGVDLGKIFPAGSYYEDPVELEMPTPGGLKINKRKLNDGREVYDFGADLPMVDVKLLKDVMDCLPGAKAVAENHSTMKMIYFTSDDGDAILLPVRKNAA